MKIKIKQKHKSINGPCEFELPKFSVLTGKNGSGKTHLLEAIANNNIAEIKINGIITQNVRCIFFNGLNPKIHEVCDPKTITEHIKNVWKQYNSAKQNAQKTNQQDDIRKILPYIADENVKRFIKKTIEDSGKIPSVLTEDDLVDSFDISFMGQNDFFTAQFALIFKNYHRRQLENKMNEFYKAIGYEIYKPILTDDEFKEKYGVPPWEFVNKILNDTNIPYEVNSPVGTRIDSNFIFKLKDKVEGFEIGSADLSTGEKVLMSLALAIYNTGGDLGKPDVLLIDEPDAGLHPSMSKLMVQVLKDNIVEENNIHTIITTHSPTTVIATEGISIYQLVRGNSIPIKISVQDSVELLSSDIPFLKISTEKRRQVFVESKYDVTYYELLTNIINRIQPLPSEPIFIPARTSNGSNCTDVINVVTNLSTNGNDQIYGIIDWDLSNTSNGKIVVLGENDRYAIENFLLDPFLMGLLFIRETKVNITDFGLSISTYSQVNQLTIQDAQLIIDKVLHSLNFLTGEKQYQITNGWTLTISEEFCKYQGHNLESLYKSKYPFLNIYQKEDSLKKDVINKVINDFPRFIPKQIIDVIMKIR